MKIFVLIFSLFFIISCENNEGVKGTVETPAVVGHFRAPIREFDYKGHTYIYSLVRDGIAPAHAGHCKCNIKTETHEKIVYDTVSVPVRLDTIVRYIRQVH